MRKQTRWFRIREFPSATNWMRRIMKQWIELLVRSNSSDADRKLYSGDSGVKLWKAFETPVRIALRRCFRFARTGCEEHEIRGIGQVAKGTTWQRLKGSAGIYNRDELFATGISVGSWQCWEACREGCAETDPARKASLDLGVRVSSVGASNLHFKVELWVLGIQLHSIFLCRW